MKAPTGICQRMSLFVPFLRRPMSYSSFLPATRPPNWKSLAAPIINFAHQPTSLPVLPVQPLPATLQRLKESLRPLARSSDEFASTCQKIDEFGQKGGVGSVLQEKLKQRKEETNHWLEEWWDDLAYLSYRDSVGSSPFRSISPLISYRVSRSLSMCRTTVRSS
jgi:hypothetical protein